MRWTTFHKSESVCLLPSTAKARIGIPSAIAAGLLPVHNCLDDVGQQHNGSHGFHAGRGHIAKDGSNNCLLGFLTTPGGAPKEFD
jgi:hypothetical protein